MTRGSPSAHRLIAEGRGVSAGRCVVVVPARLASTRVPGKVLAELDGEPLVERVRRLASRARGVDEVVVATDDDRVASVVEAGGGRVVRTGAAPTGTHRVAAALHALDAELVLNVQCDQPGLDPEHVAAVVERLRAGAEIVTLATPLDDPHDPAAVKVVCDPAGRALYFSRAPIPHGGPWLRHLGVYGFHRDALGRCVEAPDTPLERSEGLEQLRWLSVGLPIHVVQVAHAAAALDTAAQLDTWTAHPPRNA